MIKIPERILGRCLMPPLKLTVRDRLRAELHDCLQRFQDLSVQVVCKQEIWALGATEIKSIMQTIDNSSLQTMPSLVTTRNGVSVIIEKNLGRNTESLQVWWVTLDVASH